MSFRNFELPQLLEVADKFGVEIPESEKESPQSVLLCLLEDGVMYEDYLRLKSLETDSEAGLPEAPAVQKNPGLVVADEAPAPVPTVTEEVPIIDLDIPTTVEPEKMKGLVLVKMERENPHYETRGKTFTHEHPYVLMTEAEADDLFDHEDGFRLATPREAREFYN